MIAVEKLEFQYLRSDFRLYVSELSIEKGSKVALIGPSGSGKTTLLNLMAGIALPLSGRVVTAGMDVTNAEEWVTINISNAASSGILHAVAVLEQPRYTSDRSATLLA